MILPAWNLVIGTFRHILLGSNGMACGMHRRNDNRHAKVWPETLRESGTALGPTQPPTQWVPGALSLGVKRQGREADHSPPSSTRVKE
jgi:hypothetical protein